MSARQARFELVRSDAGWFARYRAANGKEVWRTSEVYTRRRAAEWALITMARSFWTAAVLHTYDGKHSLRVDMYMSSGTEVRDIDERTTNA